MNLSKNTEVCMSSAKKMTQEQEAIIKASIAFAKNRILAEDRLSVQKEKNEFKAKIERTLENINLKSED